MTNFQRGLVLFALGVAMIVVSATAINRTDARRADVPFGTVGLAQPHQQLDRAPGEPLKD